MRAHYQRITIIQTNRPPNKNINDELQWLGGSLGLFNLRDRDKSCFRIFIELIKISKAGQSVSSDELATSLALTRGTVVHHLKKLMEAGIVVHRSNHYALRRDSLVDLIEEVQRDFARMAEDLKQVAKDIDMKLEFGR